MRNISLLSSGRVFSILILISSKKEKASLHHCFFYTQEVCMNVVSQAHKGKWREKCLYSHLISPQWLKHFLEDSRTAYEWEVERKMYLEWDTSNVATGTRPEGTCISFPIFPQKEECQTLRANYQCIAWVWQWFSWLGPTHSSSNRLETYFWF